MNIVVWLLCLLIGCDKIYARPSDLDIAQLIKKYYSQLIEREVQKTANKSPTTLIVDPSIENFNVYLDDNDATSLNEDTPDIDAGVLPSQCAKNSSSSGMPPPFPAFISPFMTLLATEYTAWRSKIPPKVGCLVKDLIAVDSHPCPHENSSCVIIALPKNHVFFGCMNDQTGDLVAPKNWNPIQSNDTDNEDSDRYLIDFRVPNPLKLDRKCRTNEDGTPVCYRANIFYKNRLIAEDNACCCKGDFCADILFDQHGFRPAPFIHIETDVPQRMLAADKVAPFSEPKPDKPRSRSHRQSDAESALVSNADSATGTFNSFDWGFTARESLIVGFVIILIMTIVVTIGLWFVYEREKTTRVMSKAEIDSRNIDVFTVDTTDDYPFTLHKQGRSII